MKVSLWSLEPATERRGSNEFIVILEKMETETFSLRFPFLSKMVVSRQAHIRN